MPTTTTTPAGPIAYLQAVASGTTKAQGLKRPTVAALQQAAKALGLPDRIDHAPSGGYHVGTGWNIGPCSNLKDVAAALLRSHENAWAVKPAAQALPPSHAERVADDILAALDELSARWEAQPQQQPQQAPAAIVPAGPTARKTAPAAVPDDVKAHLARFGLAVDGLLTVGASNAKLAKGKALAWPVILHHLPAKALAQAVAGPKAGPTAPRSRIDGLQALAERENVLSLALAHNGCPWASAGCAAGCLAWAGHGGMSTTVAAARARRTLAMLADGRIYARAVLWAIARAYRQAQTKGLPLAVRLRGTDDSPVHLWRFDVTAAEAQSLARRYGLPVAPGQGLTLPEALALAPAGAVHLYEYSKAPITGPHGLQAQASAGFDVTASLAADRPRGIDQALAAVAAGFRVAVPAGFAKGQPLPEALILRNDDGGVRLLCIDGDTTDHRWADPAGPQPGGFDGVAVILRTKRSRGKGPEADAFSLTPLVGAWQPLAGGGQAAFTTVKWEA
jgi:hypothetical protein